MPWWGIALCILGGMILGGLIVYFTIMYIFAKGMQW